MKKMLYVVGLLLYTIQSVYAIKVIVPMAGSGTRVLPLTKVIQKSMLPLVDRPAAHHIVDEALQSGISDFCFIINPQDRETISTYFSPNPELDALLGARNKSYLLQELNDVVARATFTYVEQPKPLGTGHAVLLAQPLINHGDFFAVMYPDDIIESREPHLARIAAIAQQQNATVISVEEMTRERASAYALVSPHTFLTQDLFEVADIQEKVQSKEQTLCFAPMGRYVFSYDIFQALQAIEPAANGEYQLTDAIQYLIKSGKKVLAYKLQGNWHDIGNIAGLLKTTVRLGLHNSLYRDMLSDIFKQELGLRV